MPCTERLRLLALDMDGTLLTSEGKITPASRTAIRAAQAAGCVIVPATGRNYDDIPWQELDSLTMAYAVTTNGSAVYRIADRACLAEQCLPCALLAPVFAYLLQCQVYIDVFIDGRDYAPRELFPLADRLDMPEYIIRGITHNRIPLDNVLEKLNADALRVQKVTLNFWRDETGQLHSRENVLRYLSGIDGITVVDAGFGTLEFTLRGTSKAGGLALLAGQLGIPMAEVMAIGDSGNDLEMLRAVGLGIAMGNALAAIRAAAKATTCSNDEDGVAAAIQRFIL